MLHSASVSWQDCTETDTASFLHMHLLYFESYLFVVCHNSVSEAINSFLKKKVKRAYLPKCKFWLVIIYRCMTYVARDWHGGGHFVVEIVSGFILRYLVNMAFNRNAKRQRSSTGGTAQGTDGNATTYAAASSLDVRNMSDSEKLNFLIDKMSVVETLTQQFRRTNSVVDNISVQMAVLNDRATKAELRVVDLEARARRNNLIFINIPEIPNETDEQCEQMLFDSMAQRLQLNTQQLQTIVFQRVHRLGRPRRGVTPNGQPWRPRPIIAGFRDFKARHAVFGRSKFLKGTSFAIHEDFPAEIRTARGKLWGDFCKARAENRRAKIIYPAKLVIDGAVVKDMFPEWGRWQLNGFRNPPPIDPDAPTFPRSGTPMLVSLADFVQVPPLHTACPGDRAGARESHVHCCRPASGFLESTGCHALSSIFSEHVWGSPLMTPNVVETVNEGTTVMPMPHEDSSAQTQPSQYVPPPPPLQLASSQNISVSGPTVSENQHGTTRSFQCRNMLQQQPGPVSERQFGTATSAASSVTTDAPTMEHVAEHRPLGGAGSGEPEVAGPEQLPVPPPRRRSPSHQSATNLADVDRP